MAFCAYNEYQRRLLEDELGDESLFRRLYNHLSNRVLIDPNTLNYDYGFVEVWEDAKLLVETIAKEKYPTLRAKKHIKSLYCQYETFSHKPRGSRDEPTVSDYYSLSSDEKQDIEQCTLICAYFMVFFSLYYYNGPDYDIVNEIMGWIEENILWNVDFVSIKEAISIDQAKGLLSYDYNYWEGKAIPKKPQENKNCNVTEEERVLQLKERIAELEKQLEKANDLQQSKNEQGNEDDETTKRGVPSAREIIGIVTHYGIKSAFETQKECERALSQLTGLSVKTFYKHWNDFENPNQQPAKNILGKIEQRDKELQEQQKR